MVGVILEVAERESARREAEPAHKLWVGGEDWTSRAAEISVGYQDEAGGSEMSFAPGASLSGYEDAPVLLYLGYGNTKDLVPYFAGKMKRVPERRGGLSGRQARALGPFSEMAGQHFGEEVRYRGVSSAHALYDICRRASFPSGAVEVRGGNARVEEVTFYEEVTLQEGAKAVLDSANMVGGDVPGPYGSRLFLPRPRPAATGKFKARFTERDHPTDGFVITERHDAAYSRVVVFRRDQNGNYAVRQTAPVEQRGKWKAPRNRNYYIPEFVGDAKEAKQTAYDTARSLSAGEVGFALSGVEIDETLTRYDQVHCERLDERRDGTYREVYACQLDGPISASVAGWAMEAGGSGILVEERKVASPRIILPGISAGVTAIPLEGLSPSQTLAPSNELTPEG